MMGEYYILHKNFSYSGVTAIYNSSYDCDSWGCDNEGICRCGQISDCSISDININMMVDSIYSDIYEDYTKSSKRDEKLNQILNGYGKDFNIYTIDRILRIKKVYKTENWDIEIIGGYYGEEVGDVTIKEDLAKELELLINKALEIEDINERVNFLLMLEYGSIHNKLIDVKYSIVEIDRDLIHYGSQSNKKSALKEIQNSLKHHYNDHDSKWVRNINTIMGIVVADGKMFRLIDGYHRCLSTNKKMIKVLIGSNSIDKNTI
jgi:hypothetical protein